jgi:polysaccharide chain length determinant protein (PEP-CTERM system associated)
VNPQFDKLLDEMTSTWRYRWLGLAVASVLAFAGWAIIFMLPDRYGARASVLVDARTALEPALRGLALQQDVAVELAYVRESLLSDPHLLDIAKQVGLLSAVSETNPVLVGRALGDLRNHILLTMDSADAQGASGGTICGIIYRDTNRLRAGKVVTILLQTLVDETLGGKKQGSQNAQRFLEAQVKDYEKRLRAAEDQLAEFKSRNFGLMPADQGGYFAQLQKETEVIDDTRTRLAIAENQRAALEKQLHGDTVVAATSAVAVSGGASGTVGLDTLSRIAQTRAHLDELLLRYTDNHPDVIETRNHLAELEARRAAEVESLKSGDPNAAVSSGASANPVYQSIQLALNKADVDIAALRTQLGEHQEKARQLRQSLHSAPQIEAEYAQLNRDYDVNKAQYTALLSTYEKARLGEKADNAGSVKFEVVEPPTVSGAPVWPRRNIWLAAVLLASLAAGGAVANRLGRWRPTVGSAGGLAALTGVPVLAVVGSAFPSRARRAWRRELLKVSAAAACLLLAFAGAILLSHQGVRLGMPAALERLV